MQEMTARWSEQWTQHRHWAVQVWPPLTHQIFLVKYFLWSLNYTHEAYFAVEMSTIKEMVSDLNLSQLKYPLSWRLRILYERVVGDCKTFWSTLSSLLPGVWDLHLQEKINEKVHFLERMYFRHYFCGWGRGSHRCLYETLSIPLSSSYLSYK